MEWWQDKINAVKSALSGLSVPSWLNPGSPTPLELGIRGIAAAMQELNASFSGPSLIGVGGGASSNTTTNYFNMTVNTRATTPTVRQDFETMRAIYGAR
jgi:hypothetical protein